MIFKSPMEQFSRKWLPVIDLDLCNGCQACIEACGSRSLSLVNGKAVLTDPETCGSEEHCIAPCPINAIWMEWLPHQGNKGRGKWCAYQGKEKV